LLTEPFEANLVLGSTEPRLHTPYSSDLPTLGHEIVELAERLGEPLLPWQEIVANETMRIKPDGRYAHSQAVILVSRQNGKSHFMRLRIIWGLINGEKLQILSAHKLAVSLEHFNQVLDLIEAHDWLASQVKKIRRANGQEEVQFTNGARFKVVANNAAGRGYAGASSIYLDELREHKDYAAWSAITKTQLAAKNPMLYCFSNAGDGTSVVLNELRERGLATISGVKDSLLWLEWSAPVGASLDDITAWQAANPALGRTIHLDNLMATRNEPEAVVRTECLCQWVDTLQSPFSPNAWSNCADVDLKVDVGEQTYLAFDLSPRRDRAALVAAQIMGDKIAVGLVHQFESDTALDDLTVANVVAEWAKAYDVTEIAYSKNTGGAVAQRLLQAGIMTTPIDGRAFAQACDQLLAAMENQRLVHGDQVGLNKSISACARVPYSEGGWIIGRRASNANVTAAVATAMVVSLASRPMSDTDIQFG
jgi:phage terminase large subunit-like protein